MISVKIFRSPDSIPAYFLKRIAAPIFNVLSYLFMLTLTQGNLPAQWKTAIVIPIYKKEAPDLTSNYRPISLTCVLWRLLECTLANKILTHLNSNNLLSPFHFSFLSDRTSCSQLITALI